MRNYTEEFFENIQFMDTLLVPINQSFIKRSRPASFFGWLVHVWPIIFNGTWVIAYFYLTFAQSAAGLEIISQQIWCNMSVLQLCAKLINGKLQFERLQDLMKWCESVYTTKYKPDYQIIVDKLFDTYNVQIKWFQRVNTVLVGMAVSSYLVQPLLIGDRALPTQVYINGTVQWPFKIFLTLYVLQCGHGICVFFGLSAFDAIFIQVLMLIRLKFKFMSEIVELLNYSGPRNDEKDTEIINDVYIMHLDVLDAAASFRIYYFFYGLVMLGNNLFANCCILYILQTIGYDIRSVFVLMASSMQVLIASSFGQLVQDEASNFGDTLYNINWLQMSIDNKKRLLLLMTGSFRVVNIRAGGTYELNLALFAQVMKTGASLCAVMQAM